VNAVGRHPNVLIGLLLAAVAVFVFVAVVGLGTSAPPGPSPSVASASVAPSPPEPLPTLAAPSSIPPAALESPSITEIAPGVIADCGRIGLAACEQAIALARAGNEADLVGTTLIVVDDICAPEVMCDRFFPFDSIVVFVTAGGDTTGWYAFHVVGHDARVPTQAERWLDEIPRHIVDRIRAALAGP
jgi:hypothetical protein